MAAERLRQTQTASGQWPVASGSVQCGADRHSGGGCPCAVFTHHSKARPELSLMSTVDAFTLLILPGCRQRSRTLKHRVLDALHAQRGVSVRFWMPSATPEQLKRKRSSLHCA
eukprot:scaffold2409_cov121-Isochrysis_galbana.AAC.8